MKRGPPAERKTMITKTITYSLLSFDELSDNQKRKVLDKHRDDEIDCLNAEDYLDISGVYELSEDSGFMNTEWYWDINYCQGRGACFDCTDFDIDKLLTGFFLCPIHDALVKMIKDGSIEIIISRPNASYAYHYNHEKCRRLSLEYDIDDVMGYGQDYDAEGFIYSQQEVEEAIQAIENYIEQKRYKLCIEGRDRITDVYEDARSDEHITEMLKANEYLFNEITLEIEEA